MLTYGDHVDRNGVKTHALQQVLGVGVDVQLAALGVLSEVQRRDLGHVLIFPLSLLFLQLERNPPYRSPLDAFHQMRGVTGYLFVLEIVRRLWCYFGGGFFWQR